MSQERWENDGWKAPRGRGRGRGFRQHKAYPPGADGPRRDRDEKSGSSPVYGSMYSDLHAETYTPGRNRAIQNGDETPVRPAKATASTEPPQAGRHLSRDEQDPSPKYSDASRRKPARTRPTMQVYVPRAKRGQVSHQTTTPQRDLEPSGVTGKLSSRHPDRLEPPPGSAENSNVDSGAGVGVHGSERIGEESNRHEHRRKKSSHEHDQSKERSHKHKKHKSRERPEVTSESVHVRNRSGSKERKHKKHRKRSKERLHLTEAAAENLCSGVEQESAVLDSAATWACKSASQEDLGNYFHQYEHHSGQSSEVNEPLSNQQVSHVQSDDEKFCDVSDHTSGDTRRGGHSNGESDTVDQNEDKNMPSFDCTSLGSHEQTVTNYVMTCEQEQNTEKANLSDVVKVMNSELNTDDLCSPATNQSSEVQFKISTDAMEIEGNETEVQSNKTGQLQFNQTGHALFTGNKCAEDSPADANVPVFLHECSKTTEIDQENAMSNRQVTDLQTDVILDQPNSTTKEIKLETVEISQIIDLEASRQGVDVGNEDGNGAERPDGATEIVRDSAGSVLHCKPDAAVCEAEVVPDPCANVDGLEENARVAIATGNLNMESEPTETDAINMENEPTKTDAVNTENEQTKTDAVNTENEQTKTDAVNTENEQTKTDAINAKSEPAAAESFSIEKTPVSTDLKNIESDATTKDSVNVEKELIATGIIDWETPATDIGNVEKETVVAEKTSDVVLQGQTHESERRENDNVVLHVDSGSVAMDTGCQEEEEDSWDKLFNEEGDALDPRLMEELTIAVGKDVEVEKTQFDYYDFQPRDPNIDYAEYEHLIEIYDFPKEFITRDLVMAFKEFEDKGFDIKWVDDTHAIGVFASPYAAHCALQLKHPMIKVRPLCQAIRATKVKAKKTAEFLQPYKPRPETVASVARNLVEGALGMQSSVPREVREEERRRLKQAKERKREMRKQKQETWDGKIGKCAMDYE